MALRTQSDSSLPYFFGFAIMAAALVGAGGWIANIVKLIGSDFGTLTGMLIARCFGIVVPPLGAVLGFF